MIQYYRKIIVISLLLFFSFSFSSCDNRETKTKESFEQKVTSESEGKIKVTSFKKTNGIEQDFMGMKSYTIEWEAEITALEEVWKNGSFTNGFNCSNKAIQSGYWDQFMSGGVSHLPKGCILLLKGSSGLQKTDNGWIVKEVRYSITQSKP